METWGGPGHDVWNAVAIGLGVVAMYAIARIPRDRFAHGWKTKAGWILAVFLTSGAVAGYAIPVGLVFWPAAIRSSRRRLATVRSADGPPMSGYSVPGYGDVGGT